MSEPSAISTAILYTSEAHICLGRPRRRGADRLCKINLLGWKMHRRRTSSSGSTAMDWNNSSCLNFNIADKHLQRPLCNTVAFEIRLMYGGRIRRMERRHLAWNPSIFRSSALFSHIVCRQYNSFDTTQAWKMRIFCWVLKVECRQTFANLSNWPFASPNRLQISGPAVPDASK